MIFVIGERGRLGRAISDFYTAPGMVPTPRSVYENWWCTDASDSVSRYFESWADQSPTIFVASGILDPSISIEDQSKVNYLLPKNIIDGATRLGIRVVTFGTAMERLIKKKNPYIQSKSFLSDYVDQIASASAPALHIRIHTLYGLGKPSPFMFLGQILHALKNKVPFEMTSGTQLREYHHIRDEVRAIDVIARSQLNGIFEMNHGKPLSLKTLATAIFDAFDANELLRLGALPEPAEESYATLPPRSPALDGIEFRDTIPATIDYLKTCYEEPEFER